MGHSTTPRHLQFWGSPPPGVQCGCPQASSTPGALLTWGQARGGAGSEAKMCPATPKAGRAPDPEPPTAIPPPGGLCVCGGGGRRCLVRPHKLARNCTHQSHISSPCPQPRSHPIFGGRWDPNTAKRPHAQAPGCALVLWGGVCLVGWGWARRAPTWLCLRPGRPPVLAHIAAPRCPCPAKPITRRLCGSPLSPAPLLPGHGAWHGPPRVGGSKLQPPPSPHPGSICPQSPWGRQPLIPQPLEPQSPGSAVGGGLLAAPPPQHHTPDPPIS